MVGDNGGQREPKSDSPVQSLLVWGIASWTLDDRSVAPCSSVVPTMNKLSDSC